MATKYGTSGHILPRATRSSQSVSSIGKKPPKGYEVTRQPKGVQDTALWNDHAAVLQAQHCQTDPLTGKPMQTGPAHLRGRLRGRPEPAYEEKD